MGESLREHYPGTNIVCLGARQDYQRPCGYHRRKDGLGINRITCFLTVYSALLTVPGVLFAFAFHPFITVIMLGEPLTETAHSLWPRSTGTTCMSYPTVVRSVEPIELPPTERLWQRSEGESRCQSICPTVCVRMCVCAVASVVSTSVWPHGRQPAILLCPWILQATILEGVAVSLSVSCIGRQVLYLYVLPTSQNPSRWNPSWLSNASTARKDPESE